MIEKTSPQDMMDKLHRLQGEHEKAHGKISEEERIKIMILEFKIGKFAHLAGEKQNIPATPTLGQTESIYDDTELSSGQIEEIENDLRALFEKNKS